jgi:hypothetical protein
MERSAFIKGKEKLLELISFYLGKQEIFSNDKLSLEELSLLLGSYTYENRLEVKGLLTRTIIDSMELSCALGEEFIKFDKSIS